jgi:3-deoxy-7-phosphoheptulonate synthase
MASALSCPVGFKNGTDGNTRIAVDAIRAARASHMFLSPDKNGQMTIYQTSGNPTGISLCAAAKSRITMPKILPPPAKRWPNLICRSIWWWISATAIARSSIAASWTSAMSLPADPQRFNGRCRDHGGKFPERRHAENRCGQPLVYGQSITDPCLSWEDSELLLEKLAAAVDSVFMLFPGNITLPGANPVFPRLLCKI